MGIRNRDSAAKSGSTIRTIPGPSPERSVVDLAMDPLAECSQVDQLDLQTAGRHRPLDDRGAEGTSKKPGKRVTTRIFMHPTGSLGSPRIRSAMMFRWIWSVPPPTRKPGCRGNASCHSPPTGASDAASIPSAPSRSIGLVVYVGQEQRPDQFPERSFRPGDTPLGEGGEKAQVGESEDPSTYPGPHPPIT